MFETFTSDARQAVVRAQEEARDFQHNYIGTEHLLIGVLAVGNDQNPARRVLREHGFTDTSARGAVEATVGQGDKPATGHIPFTPRAKEALERAAAESTRLKHRHIGTEHILLGILGEDTGLATKILGEAGIVADDLRVALLTNAAAEAGTAAAAELHRTPAAREILQRASEIADGGPVGSHHLLLALAHASDSAAGHVLAGLGVAPGTLEERLAQVDLDTTTDVTPLQLALSRMRIYVDGDEAHIVFTDPDIVERARRVVALNDGAPVQGRGRLIGAFASLHQAADANLRLADLILGRDHTE